MPSITEIPVNKHSPIDQNKNAGVVGMTVKVNGFCPFLKFEKAEDALVFNQTTIGTYPEDIAKNLEGVLGLEGVSLKRRYNPLHNFLKGPDGILLDCNEDLKKLKYKEQTTWQQEPSFFATKSSQGSAGKKKATAMGTSLPAKKKGDTATCNESPSFKYSVEELTSEETQKDKTASGSEPSEAPSRLIQAIHQEKKRGPKCEGIHWRLKKDRPTYYGMDFFIDFFKMSDQRDVDGLTANRKFTNNEYAFLDQSREENETKSFLGKDIPVNLGVVPYGIDKDSKFKKHEGSKPLDFSDQAYIIVELGPGELGESNSLGHYFIIIADRSPPVFIQEKDGISFLLGAFRDIPGRSLLNSNFRMTVRNWLGKLVITFDADGAQIPPWIISRTDLFKENGKEEERSVIMAVPEGFITIHGGNIPIAFAFAPLQYQTEYIMTLPPQVVGDLGKAAKKKAPAKKKAGKKKVSGDTCRNTAGLVMPGGGDVTATFSVTDGEVPDLLVTAQNKEREVFTCDAQLISDDKGEGEGTFFNRPNYKKPGRSSERQEDETDAEYIQRVKGTKINKELLSKLKLEKTLICTTEDGRKRKYRVEITMSSGSHEFELPTAKGQKIDKWKLNDCKTPIMTIVRIFNDPPDIPRWRSETIDVSDHVMEFEESWIAQSFWNIEHTGNITFLLNPNPTQPLPKNQQIFALRNKAFYIEAWVKYRDCNYQRLNENNINIQIDPNARGGGNKEWKLFTGVCFGGTLEYSAGKLVMKCGINDFTKVLEDQRIFNSPFFDGVRDVYAINTILEMAGFRAAGESLTNAPNAPRSFLEGLTKNPQFGDDIHWTFPDGRSAYIVNYVLPSGYSRIQAPKFKFADASTMMEAVNQIAKTAGKLFFFDQYGLAHYENYLDLVISQVTSKAIEEGSVPPSDLLIGNKAVAKFTSNPEDYEGQSVFNQFSVCFNVADVHNHIRILTNTPDWTPIFADDLEWDSIENPDVQGFLGYLRTLYQEEGAFGDLRAVENTLQFYRTMFKPPFIVKFETYGLPLRALDIISFNDQPLRIMRISSRINPQENIWWQDYECEWFQPADVPDWAFNTQ